MLSFAFVLAVCPPASAQGTLLVLNKSDSTLAFHDATTGEIEAIVGTGVGPHEVAVSPDGSIAVVADYGRELAGNTLTVVSVEHRMPIHAIDLGEHERPHGIAFAGAERLWVTSENKQALIEVDLKERKVLRALPTEQKASHMVVLAPDLTRAYVSNIGSNSISVLDLAAGKLLAKIETGKGSEGIDVTPDGGEVWVGNRGHSISIVDAKSLTEIAEMPCKSFPIRVKVTPDGKRALVSNVESGDLAVFDVASRQEVGRVAMGVRAQNDLDQRMFAKGFDGSPVPVGVLIEPSGKRAYVANTNADVVTVIDLDGLAIVTRFKTGREPDGLGWVAR